MTSAKHDSLTPSLAELKRVAEAVKTSHSTLATIRASFEVTDFYLAFTPQTAGRLIQALVDATTALDALSTEGHLIRKMDLAHSDFVTALENSKKTLDALSAKFDWTGV